MTKFETAMADAYAVGYAAGRDGRDNPVTLDALQTASEEYACGMAFSALFPAPTKKDKQLAMAWREGHYDGRISK